MNSQNENVTAFDISGRTETDTTMKEKVAQDPAGTPAPKNSGRKSGIKTVAIVAGLFTLGFLGWRTMSGHKAEPKTTVAVNQYQVVQAALVKTGTLKQTLAVTGSLKSNLNVNLSAKMSGRVSGVLVEEGSQVRRGQLLLAFEDDELRSQVSSAQAALESAKVQLRQKQVQLPATTADIETSVEDAQANLASAREKYRQTRLKEPAQEQTYRANVETTHQAVRTAQAKLAQARTTAKQTQTQVESAIEQAQSTLSSAQANLAEVRRGSREQEVAQSQQEVNVLEAQLANAETTVKRSGELVRVGASAQSELDSARTQRDVYKSQLEAAKQALSLKREGSTNEQIRQAEETVRQAQAALTDATARRSTITNAQRDVTSAQASLATEQENLRTAQANLSNIAVTRQDTRIALQAIRQAEATLNKAKANRADIPVAREDISAARANVRQAEETLRQTRIALGNAQVFSPIDGVVNTRSTNPGETINAGSTLMNLVALNTVYFEAQVDENSVRQIHTGQPVQVTAASVSDKPITGTVTDVIAVADASRQFRVRVTFPNSTRRLTPGAFARGQITMQSTANALLVPDDAVRQSNGQKTVLVVAGTGNTAKTEQRVVQAGLSTEGNTQLLSGVRSGERIVIGNPLLKSGTRVRISTS